MSLCRSTRVAIKLFLVFCDFLKDGLARKTSAKSFIFFVNKQLLLLKIFYKIKGLYSNILFALVLCF